MCPSGGKYRAQPGAQLSCTSRFPSAIPSDQCNDAAPAGGAHSTIGQQLGQIQGKEFFDGSSEHRRQPRPASMRSEPPGEQPGEERTLDDSGLSVKRADTAQEK